MGLGEDGQAIRRQSIPQLSARQVYLMSRTIRSVIRTGYWLALAVLLVDAGFVYASLRTIARNNARIEQSRRVLVEIRRSLRILADAETGQRGYLLTERDEYLEPYRSATKRLEDCLGQLASYTNKDPVQSRRFQELKQLALEKMGELRETITLRDANRRDEAINLVLSGVGKHAMDKIRAVVDAMESEENHSLDERSAASANAINRTTALFTLTTSAGLLLILGASLLDRREQATRAKASEEIRRSEAWLSTTVTSIGDGLIATDELGQIRFLNPIAEVLTGWSSREAVDKSMSSIFRIINETTRQPVENPIEKVLEGGVIVGLANHTVLIARDGTEIPIEDSAAPIKDERGVVVGVVMVFRDVTEKRRQEIALVRSAEQFQQLADAMPQIVWTARPDGHLDYFNKRWFEFSGLPREEGRDEGWQSLLHPDDLPRCLEVWSESVRTGTPYQIEFRLHDRKTDRYRWHLVRALAARDRSSGIVKWYGTCTDIEDQKQIEEALRSAKIEAEEANKAKDRFLAVLSHELRTPLNPILLATTSMLEKGARPEDFRPNLELIRQYVNLQARLIDDLLDVMRIVRGKMPLHWDVADAHHLIRQAINICRSDVLSKGHKITVDLAATHSYINTDPARFQQVLWNLIKNAVKFTPPNGLITIRTMNVNDPDGKEGRLVIEVQDMGIGIEPEILPRLFNHFQQGEATITRKFGGLGLGLAISKGIVEGHGGSITATSAGKGQGTTFRIELKVLPEPRPQSKTKQEPKDDSTLPCHPCRLLVVEDEPATRRLMGRLLEGLGHKVMTADTLESALNAVDTTGFDLIISDIGLPDGSGLELMHQIVLRSGPIPAIALTGYGMEEDIQRSRAAGFTAHLTKPIDFMKLEAMIRQILNASNNKQTDSIH